MGTLVIAVLAILAILILVSWTADLIGLIILLASWMLAGMIAGRLVRGRGYGLLGDILLGVVGGFVGSLVLRLIGLGGIGGIPLVGGIVVGVIGALIVVWLVRVFGNRSFAR